MKRLITGVLSLVLSLSAHATQVYFAGLAYSGDAASIAERFPHTSQYLASLEARKVRVASVIHQKLQETPPKHFDMAPLSAQAELKGRDQVISVALVLNNESVSLEQFGSLAKFFVQVRGQALFFDVKSQTVLRAYPISFAYIDLLDHYPSDEDTRERVRIVFEGGQGKPGLFKRFTSAVEQATLPTGVSRFLQVSQVTIAPQALEGLSPALTNTKGAAETWLADMLAEAISVKTGAPVLPYTKGHALGKVMAMKVADGGVFSLKLPEPDYAITLDFTGVKKVELQKTAAETAYAYGSYARIRLDEPFSAKNYMDIQFKNGETKVVPATQVTVDDIPAYADSIRGLFNKIGDNLTGKTTPWLKAAAAGKNVDQQIQQSTEIIQSCK
ncbi:MAG: hypothetical protein ACK4TS_07920 [Aquabacterium sp.]|jgi:hypothetical protein